MSPTSEFAFPPGARVLHVGPHKTGTTGLQRAMAAQRYDMAEHGVHYAGATSQPLDEVMALLARENPTPPSGAPDNDKLWRQLVREVSQQGDKRVMISSEFFADAREAAMRAAVQEMGGDQVQILVTLRPLAKILPSQWQQNVQNGARRTYDKWLSIMLDPNDTRRVSEAFWWRHQHDALIARWADLVGPDRVTVLVVDDSDHDKLLRDSERLFGLPDQLLHAPAQSNRSLTLPETELIRAFNKKFARTDLPKSVYSYAMRFGAARYMQDRTPGPDEPKVSTPRWAAEKAAEIGAAAATAIEASGVRVIGDLSLLSTVPTKNIREGKLPATPIPSDVAASALIGMMQAGGLPEMLADGYTPTKPPGWRNVPTRDFARGLRRRLVERITRPYRIWRDRRAQS